MKKLFTSILFLLLAFSAAAQPAPAKASKPAGGLPPLIDRDLFFGNPEIAGARALAGRPLPRVPQALERHPQHLRERRRRAVQRGAPADHGNQAARSPGYFWTRDSKYILYVKDNDGDENFNVYAVDPAAKPAAGADAPPSRDLTGLKGVACRHLTTCPRTIRTFFTSA